MSGERLIYLPLGGAGEIGMNAYVYGYGKPGKERLMLVDLGVAFPDMDSSPGVDLILPDLSWLVENLDRLDGIVITHAHEDHIGALGHLWPLLKKPVYARKFTASIGRLGSRWMPFTPLRRDPPRWRLAPSRCSSCRCRIRFPKARA
jgi:ribonuclease J